MIARVGITHLKCRSERESLDLRSRRPPLGGQAVVCRGNPETDSLRGNLRRKPRGPSTNTLKCATSFG